MTTPDVAALRLRHQVDSYGACVTCCEYVWHTDDETVGVAFPCPTLRLAEAEAKGCNPGYVEQAEQAAVRAALEAAIERVEALDHYPGYVMRPPNAQRWLERAQAIAAIRDDASTP